MRDAKRDQLIKVFLSKGFEIKSANKHTKMTKSVEGRVLTVNITNNKLIKRATVECLRKQAEIPKEEFYACKF